MRLNDIEEFNGVSVDANEWMPKFEFKCEVDAEAYGGRTKEELIRYYLKGVAFRWYEDHIFGRGMSWDQVRSQFIARFGHYRKETLDIVIAKQDNLTLKEYIAEFKRKAAILGANTPAVTDCFVHGLTPGLKLYVMTSRPTSLEDAIELALKYENLVPTLINEAANLYALHSPVSKPVAPPQEAYRPGRSPACNVCGQYGHLARDCPKERNVRSVLVESDSWEVFGARKHGARAPRSALPNVEKREGTKHETLKETVADSKPTKAAVSEVQKSVPMEVETALPAIEIDVAPDSSRAVHVGPDENPVPVAPGPVPTNVHVDTANEGEEKMFDDYLAHVAPSKPAPISTKPLAPKLSEIAEHYDVVKDLLRAKADISFGQLLAISTEAKNQLQRSLTRPYHSKGYAVNLTESTSLMGHRSKKVTVTLNDKVDTSLVIDSGAEVNVMSMELANALELELNPASSLNLKFANGSRANEQVIGVATDVAIEVFGHLSSATFVVLKNIDYDGLLGLPWLISNGVVTDWNSGMLAFAKPSLEEMGNHLSKEGGEKIDDVDEDDDTDNDGIIDMPLEFEVKLLDVDTNGLVSRDESSLPEVEAPFKPVVEAYKELFVCKLEDLKRTDAAEHHIITTGDPIKKKPYRMRKDDADFIKTQVQLLLDTKMIEPVRSPWSFPLVVAIRNGKRRMCVDFTALNKVTKKDNYPLPNPEDLLMKIGYAKVMSTLDLFSGFWQIPLANEDREKATFVTTDGTYCFNVMPFGLCNAPATFQRMMNELLGDLDYVVVYIDDIMIFSEDNEKHCQHLEEIFKRISAANLSISGKKCVIGTDEVKFLGFKVGNGCFKPDEAKIEAIRKLSPPVDVTGVRSFVGMLRFYERFIPDFAKRSRCLYDLLKKSVEFVWTNERQAAFDDLKHALSEAPVIVAYDSSRPTRLMTDASEENVGAVLMQEVEKGCWKPVAYVSRTLSVAEKNYTVTEKECLAIIFALKKLRVYLIGIKFILQTDHRALQFLFNETKSTTPQRIMRWIIQLSEFDFEVTYIEGSKNAVADCLSRLKIADQEESWGPSIMAVKIEDDLNYIVEYLTHPESRGIPARIKKLARKYVIVDGCLARRYGTNYCRVIRDENEKRHYMEIVHEEMRHPSVDTMFALLKERVYWPSLYQDVRSYCQSCSECRKWDDSGMIRKLHLNSRIPLGELFECFHLDFIGPLPETQAGNRYLLVAIDRLSRWTLLKPCSNPNSVVVLQLLFEIISSCGCPRSIITDNGTVFTGSVMKSFFEEFGIEHRTTATYMPATNGMCERVNREIKRYLSRKCGRNLLEWDREMTRLSIFLRCKRHKELGCSPYEVVYGKRMMIPNVVGPLFQPVRNFDSVQENRLRIAKNWNDKLPLPDNPLEPGDVVMYRNASEKDWSGPFHVVSIAGPREVWISSNNQRPFRAHIDQLKVYCD